MWSHRGITCTGETYKAVVKMTFAKGASLEDPSGLFKLQPRGEDEAPHSARLHSLRAATLREARDRLGEL